VSWLVSSSPREIAFAGTAGLGLTVFPVFAYEPTEYMAALAVTAFGIHWLSLGRARMMGAATTPDAWMAIGFLLLSILGRSCSATPATTPS
jgi:hypothetical protein